jgi:hypothetical protein
MKMFIALLQDKLKKYIYLNRQLICEFEFKCDLKTVIFVVELPLRTVLLETKFLDFFLGF